jgi:hypothetical protein
MLGAPIRLVQRISQRSFGHISATAELRYLYYFNGASEDTEANLSPTPSKFQLLLTAHPHPPYNDSTS